MKTNALPQPIVHSVNDARRIAGGVCRASIYGAIHRGELEAVKVFGRTMITDRSLRARLGVDKTPTT